MCERRKRHAKNKKGTRQREKDEASTYPELSSGLSSDIVRYLRQNDRTLKDIADLTGLSESYVSRVGNGKRNFRIDHLVRLENALAKPLPLLLVEATKPDSLSKNMREFYHSLRKSFELSAKLRADFVKDSQNA